MRISVLALGLASLAPLATAQSFTPVRELKNLSPAAVDKLHTLETLNALPTGDWRFHAGDLAHGESPSLDDSAWTTIPAPDPRHAVKAPKDAVWYRRWIEVPKTLNGYDVTGSRIWFQFQADANGPMPEIIYFNGRRVAIGDDLEPIVLFEPARPGDKILVAVKLLHTVDDKSFRGVDMRIEPIGNARPNPNDIRTQIIVAANLLPTLPTPRKDLVPVAEQALNAVDFTALQHADQKAFDRSLRQSQTILAQLHQPLAADHITLAGNAHIDAAWLWPRSETIDVVKRTYSTALQLMNEYPDYTFTQSAAQYSAWIADKYPEMNAEIAQRVKEGRWEIVGGMWVEPDLNLPGGESLVRQLLVGQREFKSLYGVTARIGWNPDSFGYNWQLPQIYKRSGMDYFVTQKMHWNDTNQLPLRLFWWQSPDGSKVLTYFPTDYAWTNLNPTRLAADMAETQTRNPGTTEHLDLYGVGDHGGGPTRDMLDQGDHFIALNGGASPAPTPVSSPEAHTPAKLVSSPEVLSTAKLVSSRPEAEGRSGETSAFRDARPGTPAGTSTTRGVGASPSSPSAGKERASAPVSSAALPEMHYGTAQSYFNTVEKTLSTTSPTINYDNVLAYKPAARDSNGNITVPTWNDELYFEYHRGIYTSQAKHKENMRRSEAETLDAEKLASFAWLNGATYPAADLTENWKKITFNQFHDLAAGSGIATIYRDAQKDFTEVFHSDELVSEHAEIGLTSRIDTTAQYQAKGVPVLVFNSLPWERMETAEFDVRLPNGDLKDVTDPIGAHLHFEMINRDEVNHIYRLRAQIPKLPSLGYSLIYVTSNKLPEQWSRRVNLGDDTADRYMLANAWLSVQIDRHTGCLTSILDGGKPTAQTKTYLAPNSCGNQLQAFADNPKNYDAWNVDPGTLDKAPTLLDKADSVKLVVDGPVRKTIRVERTFNKSHITQDISLDAYADTVVIDTTIDWHEKHVLLKAAFPLAATAPKATYEIPYGSIQRATTRDNTYTKAQFEVPALRWADLGDEHQGVSILNDSKYGYDALGNTLRLTLLRSPTWPDPDADQGIQHFRYAIYPHIGPWQQAETIHRAYELNQPRTATQTFAHTGDLPPTHSFVSVDQPNVILTAVKKAEDADALIFRMYEATGQGTTVTLHIPAGATAAVETNLMEAPTGAALPLKDNTITIPIGPYEILTVQATYPHKP